MNVPNASAPPTTKSHLSGSDSGYGTASHLAISLDSSEPATQTADPRKRIHCSDDEGIQSLASENDDIGSEASNMMTRAAMTGQALISVFLAENQQFRALCEKSLGRIDKQRFLANLRRLLESFHKNLLTEAKSEGEKAVARLLRQRRGRLRISQKPHCSNRRGIGRAGRAHRPRNHDRG